MSKHINDRQRSHSRFKSAGILLLFSAITFWLSWFLMPDQGTNDTEHILHVVRQSRDSVYYSVIIQVISSVTYIPALFLLCTALRVCKPVTLAGCILLSAGAMGMCMDAVFHLVAYYSTGEDIHLQPAVVGLMTSMQTKGIFFLVPLLLAFFSGTLLLAAGLKKQAIISSTPIRIIWLAIVTALAGAVVVRAILEYGRPQLVLTVLGLFALAQAVIAKEIIAGRRGEA